MRIVALGLGVFFAFTPAISADSSCIKPRRVEIGHGSSSEVRWHVVADIKNNGSCEEWLFGVNFYLPNVEKWGSGTGIPANGHTSPKETMNAMDFRGPGEDGAFSGYIGSQAATIRARLDNGSRLEMPVRFPSKDLRRRVVWLRGFGYFVGYHSGDAEVIAASAFDRDGNFLHKIRNIEGFFY